MDETKRLGMTKFAAGMLIACFIAGIFAGTTVRAAVDYTGSVTTTDSTGTPKDTFVWGEDVYVNVELNYHGTPYDGDIRVVLVRAWDGAYLDFIDEVTDDPVVGWYNSSQSLPINSLVTYVGIPGDLAVYNVIAYERWSMTEIGFVSITVLNTGLWVEPSSMLGLYPGEEVTISLITSHTTDVFYADIVNETGVTKVNWTGQVALEGYWSIVWVIPSDFSDGFYQLRVRDADTHVTWEEYWFLVQEFTIVTTSDRSSFLPGESATVTYSILSIGTLEVQDSLDLTYSAHWFNITGADKWDNGTITGGSGVHVFNIPTDIALYSDVVIDYWIEETPGIRTAETEVWLYLGMLDADISVDSSYYTPGNTVSITVNAQVGWEELPGADVDIVVTRQGTAIAEYGASELETDAYGTARHSFRIASNESQGTLVVSATISKAEQSVVRATSFEVGWNGGITITLDRARYNAGDTVTASFQVFWNNEYLVEQMVTYLVATNSGMLTIGNTTSGSVSFDLPADYYGVVWIEAVVNLNGYLLMNTQMAEVVLTDVLVTATKDNYDALDVIEFDYVIVSIAQGAELRYEIVNSMGIYVAGSSLPLAETGTISFTVPAMPSASYTCIVSLVTQGGMVISAYDTANLNTQYEIVVQIHGPSHLLGSFEPGETAVIEYTILEHGLQPLAAYGINIYASWNEELTLITTDARGNVSLPISEDASNGWAWVQVELFDPVADMWLASVQAMMSIDDAASEWDLVIEGLQEDVASLSDQISDQGNMTSATLEDIWGQVNATQAEIDILMNDLETALETANETGANVEQIMIDLAAMDAQLESLQTQLEALQEDMNAVEDDVSARPTGQSVAMWLAIAVVVLIVAGVAIAFIMKKKA